MKTHRLPLAAAAVFAAALVLVGCARQEAPPARERPVLTGVIGGSSGSGDSGDDRALSYAGEVRSRYETALAFRIPGKVTARLVDAGARVKPGDVLARLDPSDTALSLAAAKAQLELADADARRFRELRAKNFVSQSALDAKETTLKAAQAQADIARNQSAYTTLRAEEAAVVAAVAVEVGQVVAAGQTVFRLARTDTLEVAVAIPEASVAALRARPLAPARVTLWADDAASYAGHLRELSPIADALTRTYAARVALARPDAKIALGMSATVSFEQAAVAGAAPRLAVPLTAVFQDHGQPALWIVGSDDTIALRPVVIAAYTETSALIASGVRGGERYVVAGVHKLSAGAKIRPQSEAAGVLAKDGSAAPARIR